MIASNIAGFCTSRRLFNSSYHLLLVISETAQWKRLEAHTASIKQMHLRNMLQDSERCRAMIAEHNGILLDYSRQNVTLETMVGPFKLLYIILIITVMHG